MGNRPNRFHSVLLAHGIDDGVPILLDRMVDEAEEELLLRGLVPDNHGGFGRVVMRRWNGTGARHDGIACFLKRC